MRKIFHVAILLILILVLIGCKADVEEVIQYGTLAVSASGTGESTRTIEPALDEITCSYYKVIGTHSTYDSNNPNPALKFETRFDSSTCSVVIMAGTWNVYVEGYNDQDLLIARSENQSVVIINEATTNKSFDLSYLAEGNGIVDLLVRIPDTTPVAKVSFKIGESETIITTIPASVDGYFNVSIGNNNSLPVGDYSVQIKIFNSSDMLLGIPLNDRVHVYANLTSSKTWTDPGKVVAPVITTSGSAASEMTVSITTETEGASIYYSIDGSTPSARSIKYIEPFSVTESLTVKAIAVHPSLFNSNVTSESIVMNAATPSVSIAEGTYSNTQTVSLSCTTAGASIRYTLDGSTPNSESTLYSTPITVDHSLILKAIAYKDGYEPSDILAVQYVMESANPTFSVNSGIIVESQTSDVTIRYTTDGTIPSESSPIYSTPISADNDMIIRAIAFRDGFEASGISSAEYHSDVPGVVEVINPDNDYSVTLQVPGNWSADKVVIEGVNATIGAWLSPANPEATYNWSIGYDGSFHDASSAVTTNNKLLLGTAQGTNYKLLEGTNIIRVVATVNDKKYDAVYIVNIAADGDTGVAGDNIVYSIGDTGPAGGIIVYDCDADNDSGNSDGLTSSYCKWRYMEAAPAELRMIDGVPSVDSSDSGYSTGVARFKNGFNKSSTGAFRSFGTSTAVGYGFNNTLRMISGPGGVKADTSDTESGRTYVDNSSAGMCSLLSYGGADDWFLPSKDEMYIVYSVLQRLDSPIIDRSHSYKSSSEDRLNHYSTNPAAYGWYWKTIAGGEQYSYRDVIDYVLPVRVFLSDEPLGHTYNEEVITEPTCTTSGTKEFTCQNCGYSYTETIPSTGHHLENGVCTVCSWNMYEELFDITSDGVLTLKADYKYNTGSLHSTIPAEIIIPQEINGIEVVEIEHEAFYNCETIHRIVLPSSVKKTGIRAFAWSRNLEEVVLNEGLEEIKDSFDGNDSLESIVLPSTVSSITGLHNLSNLTSIIVSEDNPFFRSSEDGVLFSKDGTTLINFPRGKTGSYTVPSEVSVINSLAFYKSKISSVTIQGVVTEISDMTFCDCPNLRTVVLPDSVERIMDFAFEYCATLSSINWPASLTEIRGHAFSQTGLTSISLPASLQTIGSNAFSECPNLQSVHIHSSIETTGSSVSSAPFYRCSSLTEGTVSEDATSIPDYLFATTALTSFSFPDSITTIGDYAFYGCEFVELVFSSNSNLTSIGNSAFQYCDKLTSVSFPDSLRIISYGAFQYCKKLTNIVIPSNVISIGSYAFSNCDSLTSITIPNTVTSIGSSTFSYCSKLTSISIPSGVTKINNSTFYGCTSMSSCTLPASITSIGSSVWYSNKVMTSINFNGTMSQWISISKTSGYISGTNITSVVCSDGSVIL